jgi:hypothetical protein
MSIECAALSAGLGTSLFPKKGCVGGGTPPENITIVIPDPPINSRIIVHISLAFCGAFYYIRFMQTRWACLHT